MTPFPLFWHGKPNMMQNGVCCNNATAPHLLLISMCHRNILEPVISFPSCQLTMIKKYAYQIHLNKSNHQTCNCSAGIQGNPLQTVELLHHKKIFNNGQKKSPLLHIDQNMTPFIILEKNFFVPFKKVEFLFAFVAKQSFVEQNGAHFWHISSKTS